MTPAKAIKIECSYCTNGYRELCNSTMCKLIRTGSPLKRIRAHCLDCFGGAAQVKACDGKVLGNNSHICPLHHYRDGHNPKLKGRGNVGNLILFKKIREEEALFESSLNERTQTKGKVRAIKR